MVHVLVADGTEIALFDDLEMAETCARGVRRRHPDQHVKVLSEDQLVRRIEQLEKQVEELTAERDAAVAALGGS